MKPLMLIILDGWGLRDSEENNAIAQAYTPHYDGLLKEYPHAKLDASGQAVGLPQGIMGNSEVGHLNMGAGRIAKVGLTRIYQAIEDGSFFKNPALLGVMEKVRQQKTTLHLMGLVSDGAVHSHQDHLYALLKMAKQEGLSQVAIHAFLDGRDTDPRSAKVYLKALEDQMQAIGIGKIATISGRYFAMDRDQRWDRIAKAYGAMVLGGGLKSSHALSAVDEAYGRNENDEFVTPTVLTKNDGSPTSQINDGDGVLFFNFRADRAREMTRALTEDEFTGFERSKAPRLSGFACMGEFDKKLLLPVAFPPEHIPDTLGEIIARKGLKQLRIAETEKYAHVTFFFNGGEEAIFPGEERVLIPSPREVATYDLKPEMSAPQITKKVMELIEQEAFDVIILNFANADMVGHSGKLPAAIRAVEIIDEQLGKISKLVLEKKGAMMITADHGNCEKMSDENGNAHTAHTTDLVPLMLIASDLSQVKLRNLGTLADIAPTMLQLLNIPQPAAMTGQSMILKGN